jgi:hypothetical protein
MGQNKFDKKCSFNVKMEAFPKGIEIINIP